MKLTEKIAYMKGLIDGMELDGSTKEGKAILQMADVMEEMAVYIDDLQSQVDELTELCDLLDEDLGDVESDLYGDDDDDDEDDDMAARLGLSPDLRQGHGSSSQPPSGLALSVSGARTSGSRSKEQGQAEGVLNPLAEVVEVTPESQADPHVP